MKKPVHLMSSEIGDEEGGSRGPHCGDWGVDSSVPIKGICIWFPTCSYL